MLSRRATLACMVGISCSLAACSGLPAAPSPSSTSSITQLPPAFPNVVGAWQGTDAISTIEVGTGIRGSNTCTDTWIVSAQLQGDFSGTFQTSGGTSATCASSGTLTGWVTATGVLESLTFSTSAGATSPFTTCTRISGSGIYTGAATATAITGLATDRVTCTTTINGRSSSTTADRTIAVAVNKR